MDMTKLLGLSRRQDRPTLMEALLPRRTKPEKADGPFFARSIYTLAIPVIVLWLLAAGALNLLIPQVDTTIQQHAQPFLPDESSSVQALVKVGKYFGSSGSMNYTYVLLEGQDPLGTEARSYYSELVKRLGQDKTHVNSVLDLWSNPDLAPANQSRDGKAAFVLLNLAGNMGSAEATRSTQAVRDAITAFPPPEGIKAYVTGPTAVVNDEFASLADSILLLLVSCTVVITAILIWVYRSPVTIVVPLLTVGVALAISRAIVSYLGSHGVIGVSVFASALLAVVVLGAGTDYGIFLLGRYQEAREAGEDPTTAYFTALAGTQYIIIASGLTVAGATACMIFTRLSIFYTAGLPCTIAVMVTLAAALTLGPSLLALYSRLGFLEPNDQPSLRRWRRIGTVVVRWPGPVLAGSLTILLLLLTVLPTYKASYDERKVQPADSPANQGIAAADRHFPKNIMVPNIMLIEADHDMRNSADLIVLAKLSNAVLALPGISAVQGITRPLTTPIEQGTLTSQAGYVGNRFTQMTALIGERAASLTTLNDQVSQLALIVDRIQASLAVSAQGFRQLGDGGEALRGQLTTVVDKLNGLREVAEPAEKFVNSVPNCMESQYCQAARSAFSLFDDLNKFDGSLQQFLSSEKIVSQSLPQLSTETGRMREVVGQLKNVLAPLKSTLNAIAPQLSEITDFAKEVSDSFASADPGGSFFLPSQALENPLFKNALPYFFSPDGKATRLIVTTEMEGFSEESMDLSAKIVPTALGAIKGTSLAGSTVSVGGAGGTLLNVKSLAREDFITTAVAAFVFVFCVVLILLRSLVAALTVIFTVALSFVSAMGLAIFIWQHLLGTPLHWSVLPISFTFLVAVGADYNMLLAARFKEELSAGIKTGIIRSMAKTGRVVTTAGLVFGMTMFALLASYAKSIAQVGTTVGIGLLLDTLIVRSFVIPAIATLLGRWFWWPIRVRNRPERIQSQSIT